MAITAAELLDLVTEMASKPRVQQANGFRREAHDLDALVRAAQLLSGMAEDAAATPARGMRLTKLNSPACG